MSFNKKFFICAVLFIIILIGLHLYLVLNNSPNDNEVLLDRLNKIELKLDSIKDKKDSIRINIDSTHVKIITNEKHYEERINNILIQPYSTDSGFIIDYIRQYSDKNPQYHISGT